MKNWQYKTYEFIAYVLRKDSRGEREVAGQPESVIPAIFGRTLPGARVVLQHCPTLPAGKSQSYYNQEMAGEFIKDNCLFTNNNHKVLW